MNQFTKVATGAVLLATLAACAAGSDAAHQAVQGGAASALVVGFWHGLIAPITLLVEVLNALTPGTIAWTPRFYETGGANVFYDVGFFVGVIAGPSILWTGLLRRR